LHGQLFSLTPPLSLKAVLYPYFCWTPEIWYAGAGCPITANIRMVACKIVGFEAGVFLVSRSHAPHGNAFWMRRIQAESFISDVCNGLQRRPGGVPMRRMGTRQPSPVSSIICGTWTAQKERELSPFSLREKGWG